MHVPTTRLLPLLAASSLALAACGGSATGSDAGQQASSGPPGSGTASTEQVEIVATTSIYGDIVRSIVGEDASVEVLMGPGVDPHAFSPSAQQAQSLREADLVVANGLQLEESLLDTLEAAEEDGARVLYVAEDLDPITYEAGEEAHAEGEEEHAGEESDEGEEGPGHGAVDPHVWFDPTRMAEGATMIAASVAEVDDTLEDAVWEQRGQAYADELTALDEELTETLAAVEEDQRQLVTNHDAFAYFAEQYDFEVVGTVIPGASTQVDTSAEAFGELAELIAEQEVPAIFSETTSSDDLANALAEEVGREVEIVQLYSGALGGQGSGAETYIELLRFDAQAIADALA